ncbi:MAG: cell envelope integrity protein CreD [Cellvibrionaceae bacterium]
MAILFSLIGLVFFLALLAGAIFFAIFMARKLGFIQGPKQQEEGGLVGSPGGSFQSYLSYLKQLSRSLVFRFALIVVLVGLMNIPLSLVSDVVSERNGLYHSVLSDIADTWGQQQSLSGPALLIPYTDKITTVKTVTDKDGIERRVNQTNYYQRTAIVLPENLEIDAALSTKTRQRNLYEAQVYSMNLSMRGRFKRPDIGSLSNNIDKIHWDRAWLTLGITDTQAINSVSALSWQYEGTQGSEAGGVTGKKRQQEIDFEPGTKMIKTLANGFHAPIDLSYTNINAVNAEKGTAFYTFALDMNANGSKGFYFTPFGKVTNVKVRSDWPHPSFQGSVLPNDRQVSAEGFDAYWSVPNLARSYPQLWTLETNKFNVNEFVAGVDIFESVSLYSKVTRAIKYGSLFFILTYIVFLLFELGINKSLHLVQYGMIGLALSLFYLTLLSLAEHFGFLNAYLSAAFIIIVMVSLYAYSAIRSLARASIVAVLLTVLYGVLYSVLKLEESALLSGTFLLLLILGVMMYMTRNIGVK